ncbi:ALP1-like protein [Tanacetum coccineum]
MGATTARGNLVHFCTTVMELYGRKFLRQPTYIDMVNLYAHHEQKHGFSGMIGSIDCTDWPWENCPNAFRAQFCRGDHESDPFILLEALASQALWIWHAFFGDSGMNNDVNVLRQSPIFNDLKSKAPEVSFVANEVTNKRGYYLTDGIYPELSILIKSISNPGSNDHKRKMYKTPHEASLKDVERAFEDNEQAISPRFYPDEQHRDDDPVRTHEETVCVVSWEATLQYVVALSTTEVEYMALTEAMKEAMCLGNPKCSNCKLLAMKIKIPETRLDIERHPKDHACQSATILHELLNEMENLRME